jgi:hypothetical protein
VKFCLEHRKNILALGTKQEYRTNHELIADAEKPKPAMKKDVEKWSTPCITCCLSLLLRRLLFSCVTWCRWRPEAV